MNAEHDTKLVTVFEVRYKGEVIFSKQFDTVLNDMDIVTESDLRNLPMCKKCKRYAVWYRHSDKSLCEHCYTDKMADMNAATDQMFAIGYW